MNEAERWNLSPERLYIDTWTRWFLRERLPWDDIETACNVGIGQGDFDDWLGFALGSDAELVSIDRDPHVVATFQARQRDEGHPNAADALHDELFTTSRGPFDLVTVTGSVLQETGDPARSLDALLRLVAPGGWLYAVVLHELGPDDVLDGLPGTVQRRRFDRMPGAGLTAALTRIA